MVANKEADSCAPFPLLCHHHNGEVDIPEDTLPVVVLT